jgi:hypothetical protein
MIPSMHPANGAARTELTAFIRQNVGPRSSLEHLPSDERELRANETCHIGRLS